MAAKSENAGRKKLIMIVLAFAAIYIIWGTTYLAISIAVETLPAFIMAGTRFLFSGILIFTFMRLRGHPMPTRLHWRSALIVGALLIFGGTSLLTWSEKQVPSSTASLVIATVPLWIALYDWLLFEGRRPGLQIALGLLLGLVGIILLIGPGQIYGTAQFNTLSLIVLLFSPILWSLGSLYSRSAPLPANTFMTIGMEMIAGGAVAVVAGLLTGEGSQLMSSQFSNRSILAMIYLTIFGSIIGFSAYIWLLRNVQATKVATYSYVNPVLAVFLGWLILNETITFTTLAAVVLIVLAVILITTYKSPAAVGRRNNAPTNMDRSLKQPGK